MKITVCRLQGRKDIKYTLGPPDKAGTKEAVDHKGRVAKPETLIGKWPGERMICF
jgi:hypothetical protein